MENFTLESLENRLCEIENRNKRVEIDKAWETSTARKIFIAVLTYSVVLTFFFLTETESPFLNALVPTGGFILSTLSLGYLKKWWIEQYYNSRK